MHTSLNIIIKRSDTYSNYLFKSQQKGHQHKRSGLLLCFDITSVKILKYQLLRENFVSPPQ